MEKMILTINGSIFSGNTDGKYFYFNMIDRAEMGDKVELAVKRSKPLKADGAKSKFAIGDPVKINDENDELYGEKGEITEKAYMTDTQQYGYDVKVKGQTVFYYEDELLKGAIEPVKADEVVDAFPGSGEGSGSGSGSGSGDAVIVEPVAEEIGEIKEEKVEVEILKDIKQDLKDAEKGIDEMIKHEGGEVVEELGEIAPELGPIDPLAEPIVDGMPEPMLAKKEKKRKFEVDPTEVGKKDLVKGAKGNVKERLEYLRKQIENENISYGEIAELQDLAEHIDPDDVQLLEWAGVEEFGDFRQGLRDKKDKGTKKDAKKNK